MVEMSARDRYVFHITTPEAWSAAEPEGGYSHPSLASEGFIHMSTRDELLATTDRHYQDAQGLILLEVDTHLLQPETLIWELAPAVGREFPHSYGPIPTAAVVGTHPWDPGPDGNRSLPPIRSNPPAR